MTKNQTMGRMRRLVTSSSFSLQCFWFLLCAAASTVFVAHGLAASSGTRLPSPMTAKTADHLPLAKKAMEYFDASPDPFHAVQTSIDLLESAGFEELADGVSYKGKVVPGGKYYFTRNKSTLVAFAVGNKVVTNSDGGDDGDTGFGFKVIGGHTDSPNLKVKPRSKRGTTGVKAGSRQIGVECYGGGLWHTWFDRDLGISGRVLVRCNDDSTSSIQQRLVKLDRAILRVPNLAIHLQTAKDREAFKVNKEDHLSPILAMEAKKSLTGAAVSNLDEKEDDESDEDEDEDDDSDADESNSENETAVEEDGWTEYQEPLLLQLLSEELGVDTSDIADFELNLFDIQKANLGGAFSEFVHSARLDNLASCFLAVQALVEHVNDGCLDDDEDISMIVLYDHEEVGSTSAVGAASPIMGEAVRRISAAIHSDSNSNEDTLDATLRKSFVLSVDQAHAVHPNYAAKHEISHQPKMNEGMVIKRNSNQRYATTAVTGFLVREIAKRAGLPPVQEFIVRQDCGCGSTIGPLISSATGIRAIDMGCPQLSMHSIRETMGVCDCT